MLKEKLKNWLFKDELDEIRQAKQSAEICKNEILRLQELVTPLFDVGVDVGMRDDHSWAVVCIKGRPEFVKFIPLDHRDARDVIRFLESFRKSNLIVDSPLAFKDMLNRELFCKRW